MFFLLLFSAVEMFAVLSENEEQAANVKAVISRLKPLVQRALDDDGQPLAGLGDDADSHWRDWVTKTDSH